MREQSEVGSGGLPPRFRPANPATDSEIPSSSKPISRPKIMPILPNPRHERFAQLLAKGKSATEAYADAGYKDNRQAASRMFTNVDISMRVAELQDKVAKRAEITAESLAAEADEIRRLAIEDKQFSAAVSALREKGILTGQRIEKSERGSPGEFDALDDEAFEADLRAQAAELGIELGSETQH